MCIFPPFLLFQLKENLLKANFNILSLENFRTLLNFGPEIFRTRFCPKIKTSEIF